jgi:hypothetical protein
MTKKLSVRLFYGLMFSIVAVMIGFLGLGVRAFASAVVADFIFLGAFGVILVVFPMYFILHRPLAGTVMDEQIRRPFAAWPGRVPRQVASGLRDRPRPLLQGQERATVALERRSKQLAGIRVVSLEPGASETLHESDGARGAVARSKNVPAR